MYFQSVFSIPQKHATGTSENWLKIHIYRWNADFELWKFWIMKIDWKYIYTVSDPSIHIPLAGQKFRVRCLPFSANQSILGAYITVHYTVTVQLYPRVWESPWYDRSLNHWFGKKARTYNLQSCMISDFPRIVLWFDLTQVFCLASKRRTGHD